MDFIDKIFFYGSLKSDGPFYSMYSKNVLFKNRAYTYGRMAMYKETFPALLDDENSIVYGELVTVFNVNDVLMVLDNVERYLDRISKTVWILPDEGNDYADRQPKAVTAWVYIYRGDMSYISYLDMQEWDNKQLKL